MATVDELVADAALAGAYTFQVDAVRWLAPRKRALLADDMGIGKTIEALLSIPKNSKTIVICPASVKWIWFDEVTTWRPDLEPRVLKGRGEGALLDAVGSGEVFITNYAILPQWLNPDKHGITADRRNVLNSCTLIVDECQKVKNYQTARSKKVVLLSKLSGRVWLLTGTPLENKPFDLWGVLKAGGLDKEVFSWPTFLRLFGAKKGRWGGYVFANTPSPQVAARLRRVMLRRTKKEVLPHLPPKLRRTVRLDIARKLKTRLDELWDEFECCILDDKLPPFERFSTIRAELAAARIPDLIDMAESYEEQSIPLVVFSAHRSPIDELARRDGWVSITGDVSASDRHEAIRKFQSGEAVGIALTIGAGGEGITLTRASDLLFVDLAWNPSANNQAEDRVCRIGQESRSINITILVGNHILDEHVLRLLTKKQQLINMAIDGPTRGEEL